MNCKGRIGDVEWALIHDWSLHEPSGRLSHGHPNVSIQEIADRLNVSRGAVQYSLAQPVRPSLRKKATPPPISSAQAQAIALRRKKVKKLVQMTVGTGRRQRPKFPSCELIAAEMRRALQSEDWHYATVYRDLLHLGYTSKVRPHVSAEKGKSDPVQRFNCCEWMLDNVDLEWMIFSDEKYFDDSDHGTRRQWCLGDEKPQPLEETQFCTTSHFWGCIGKDFRLLIQLPHGMGLGATSRDFIRVCLEPFLKKMASCRKDRKKYTLQQDGNSIHESKESIAWIEDNGLHPLGKGRWPAYSPDLSPIENIWALMERMVSDMILPGTDHLSGAQRKAELQKNVWKAWNSISQETINGYVASAKGRFEECLGLMGGVTNH